MSSQQVCCFRSCGAALNAGIASQAQGLHIKLQCRNVQCSIHASTGQGRMEKDYVLQLAYLSCFASNLLLLSSEKQSSCAQTGDVRSGTETLTYKL